MAKSQRAKELRSLMDRRERLEEEKDALSDDIKELLKEVDEAGFDKHVFKATFQQIRRRDRNPEAFDERAERVAEYLRLIDGEEKNQEIGDSRTHASNDTPPPAEGDGEEGAVTGEGSVPTAPSQPQGDPERGSNRDVSAGDEAWPGGVPQDNRLPSFSGDLKSAEPGDREPYMREEAGAEEQPSDGPNKPASTVRTEQPAGETPSSDGVAAAEEEPGSDPRQDTGRAFSAIETATDTLKPGNVGSQEGAPGSHPRVPGQAHPTAPAPSVFPETPDLPPILDRRRKAEAAE